jgi:hypothetical protein
MHPVAAFLIGLCVMGIFFSSIQKSPTKEEIAYALSQRDAALSVLVDEINKLKKKK